MKITSFSITSATALQIDCQLTKPICLFHGRNSDLVIDLLRELIGDPDLKNSPDRVDDGRFVVHAETEIDGKHYSVCYLRNADCMGDFRIAVNFIPNSLCFSEDDTFEYLQKCRQSNNTRPIFLYGTLDCMDEAKIPSFLEELATLNRQVFISACQKIQHEMIQNENINLPSMGVPYNECQTVVLCPVCGNKTLDCHAICPHCNWQNDGLPEDQYSAANGSTLAEYRTEYLKRKENE